MMKRATGLGGIFFKAADPKRLAAWYRDHLRLAVTDWGRQISGEGKFGWVVGPEGNKIEL
jgi:hypothetical protein